MKKEDKAVLDRMHENWALAEQSESVQRDLELDDYRYCAPEHQWEERLKSIRVERGLPCETDDQIGNFVRLTANAFAQARPQPKVSPVGEGSDIEIAKVRQGLIRHIMYASNGDVAIDNAFLQMVRGGVGYARVITEENYDGVLDIKVKRIPNRFQVYFDPFFEEPDGCDANFAFIASDITRNRFKLEYPDAKLSETGCEWVADGNEYPDWVSDKSIRIVEYYERVPYTEKWYTDEMGQHEGEAPEGVTPISTGERKRSKVTWYKATYNEILEQTEWPDEYIPVIPMLGEELILDGSRTFAGIIRSAKDAQKRINYYVSQQIQAIAIAPKAPWIAQADSLVRPQDWVNDDGVKVLFWKQVNSGGQPTSPPTRDFGQVDIGAITQAYMQAVESLKATTGMFAPSLGNPSGQSGKAIDLLQQQGSTGNGHFTVAAMRFMRHLGRIINNLVPKIYDTPRIVSIVKPDEQIEMVAINQLTSGQDGRAVNYAMGQGRYDVTVDIGPSYQTKRQENKTELVQLLQGPLGQIMAQIAPDLALSQWDFDMSDEILDRVKRYLAISQPQLAQQGGAEAQIPPEVQQQIQQGMQQMQQLQQALQQLQQENQQLKQGTAAKVEQINTDFELEKVKAVEQGKLEYDKAVLAEQTKYRIAELQEQTKRAIAQLNANTDLASTAVNNAMSKGTGDVEIELGSGNSGDEQYNDGAGTNAGMEE